jgi:glucose/arabinose dehydrogenase
MAILLGASLLLGEPASAQDFETLRIASGLARPVFVTAPPDDSSRVFVVEQHTGRILIIRLPGFSLEATPFLTIPGISTGEEQGLLGLAFHPDYASNGLFYVNYTDPDTQIVRYQVSADPDVADPPSATPVLSFDQPQSNHNGGWIGFGPDGFLYIASGDGGGGNDSGTGHTSGTGNAQDVTGNLLGKILRIDVDADAFPGDPLRNYAVPADNPFVGVAGDDEIWVYGLRNPWRASFDRLTGDLYIGDVGQNACEELDVQPSATTGGENYGWRLREGVIATPTGGVGGPHPPGAIDPIFDYPHGGQICSDPGAGFTGIAITGGYVYRGPVAGLDGRYFFADFGTGRLWSLRYDGSPPSGFDGTNYVELTDHAGDPAFTPDAGTIGLVSSFGEDAEGNLYVADLGGEVFYIPEPPAAWMQLAAVAMTWVLGRRRARPQPTRGRGERPASARDRNTRLGSSGYQRLPETTGNPDVTVVLFEGADHTLMQPDRDGYLDFAPGLLSTLGEWLSARRTH